MVCDPVVLEPSPSQAARWSRCAEQCGYASVEEWLAAAAEAEILRQRAAGFGEEKGLMFRECSPSHQSG